MQGISVFVLLLLLTISHSQQTNRWEQLIPRGKEVDYRYEATVRAGTQLQDAYSSIFHLRGVLHVQAGQGNDIVLRLSDMNYTLDNGKESEFPEKTPIGIPDQMRTLTKPFRIRCDDNGRFQEIGVEENVPDQVLNIKKALASLLQVDWKNVRLDSTRTHSFKTVESGLHGQEENLYTVIPRSKTVKIEKMHHMKSAEHLYHHIISSINLFHCDDPFEDALSHDSQKVYIVDKTRNVLQRIENTGGIYYHPYRTVPPAQSIHIMQSLDMIEMHNIEKAMTIEKENKIKSLEFAFQDVNENLEIVLDKQPLVTKAQHLLEELCNFVETRKVDMSAPDFKKGQLPSRLQNILKHFDKEMFKDLLKSLQEKDAKQFAVFCQMLPHVGTQSSTKVLIRLIKDKRMNDFLAIKALQAMPFFTVPDEQTITESEVLLRLEGVSPQVQNTALLTFGSLLQRLQNRRSHQQTRTSEEIIEKHIRMCIDKVKQSSSVEDKHLWLNVLFNIRSPLVIKHLRPWLETEKDNNLRLQGLLVLFPLMSKNPELLQEVCLPILRDRRLPTDLRTIALHTIIQSQPSLSLLINLNWIMQSETDNDVYQFYYTSIKSLANTRNPCDRQIRMRAVQLMKYMQVPIRTSLTQYRKIDVVNWELNAAEYEDMFIIDTTDSLLIKLGQGKNMMNLHTKPYTLFIRISGLQGRVLSDLKLNIKKQMKLFNEEQIMENLMKIPKMENVAVELAVIKQGQIIFGDLIKKSNFDSKKQAFAELVKQSFQNIIHLDFDLFYRITIPSDIGFPLMSTAQTPVIGSAPLNFKADYNNNLLTLNVNGKLKEMKTHIRGLYVHNPISHSWQGVAKMTTEDEIIPLNFEISANLQQDVLKFSWRRHKNPEDDIFAWRSYVGHLVQNYDYLKTETLKRFNPNTDNLVVIPLNTDLRNNHTVQEIEDPTTGYTGRIEVFDTEDAKSMDEISKLRTFALDTPSFIDRALKQVQFDNNLFSRMLKRANLQRRLSRMPEHEIRGVLMKWEPTKANPLTNIDLAVRLNHEITKETPSAILPGLKIILKASCALKKEQEVVKRWDANLSWDLNNGHTQNNIKAQLTRTIPGQTDYKICVEGAETYSDTGITGNLNILMSSSPEGTCKTDETVINIKMKGERLQDQQRLRNNFPSCRQQVFSGIRNMPSQLCLADRMSIRRYEIEIDSKNIPKEFQSRVDSFLQFIKVKYDDHCSEDIASESQPGKTKAILTWPISNDILDIEMTRKGRHTKLQALPAANFRRLGLIPDNLFFGNVQRLMQALGLVNTCSFDVRNIKNVNGKVLSNAVTEDWVLAIGDAAENPEAGLFVKRVDDKLALKVVQKMHILLVLPVGNTFTLTLDGKNIPNEPLIRHERLILMAEKNNLVVLMKGCGTQIVYNPREMWVEVLRLNVDLTGKCLQNE